jgi:hypothetical protein
MSVWSWFRGLPKQHRLLLRQNLHPGRLAAILTSMPEPRLSLFVYALREAIASLILWRGDESTARKSSDYSLP